MTGESTLPDAEDRILQLFSQAAGGVLVADGMGLTDSTVSEAITVGYTDNDDESSAEGGAAGEGAGGVRDRERYDVHCAIRVVNADAQAGGTDGDPAAARRRAFDLLAALRAALIADQRLGGAVMRASLSDWQYRGNKTSGGARALIRFDVNCDGYTRA